MKLKVQPSWNSACHSLTMSLSELTTSTKCGFNYKTPTPHKSHTSHGRALSTTRRRLKKSWLLRSCTCSTLKVITIWGLLKGRSESCRGRSWLPNILGHYKLNVLHSKRIPWVAQYLDFWSQLATVIFHLEKIKSSKLLQAIESLKI